MEKVYKLVLENSCGEQFTLAEQVTLPQANMIVDGLDARYELLDGEFDGLDDNDPMLQYEGGNVLALADGIVMLYTGEDAGWETLHLGCPHGCGDNYRCEG